MTRMCRLLAAVTVLGIGATAMALDLTIGDKAPQIQVDEWVKGEPIQVGESADKIVVVEFWATWCGPCVASFPHLTEIQHKFGDRVAIVGVTTHDDNNTLDMVRKMVGEKAEEIDYRVAYEKESRTNDAFMKAAEQNGIPTAFVVDREGTVAWIGHPMIGLESTLQKMLDGKYDIAKARKTYELRGKMQDAWMAGKFDEVLRLADERIAHDREDFGAYRSKLSILLGPKPDREQAMIVANELIQVAKDEPEVLSEVGVMLASRDGDEGFLPLASMAADRALHVDKDNVAASIAKFQVLAKSNKEGDAYDWASASVDRFKSDGDALARFASALSSPERTDQCTTLAIKAVDLAIKAEPEQLRHLLTKFEILATCRKDLDAARKTGNYLIEQAADDAEMLNNFAWMLLTEEGVKGKFNDLALTTAQRCDRLSEGKNWAHLDTYALALFENGKAGKAIEMQEMAIKAYEDGPALAELKERLEQYKGEAD